jgi:alcohol dehydrogenase (NADP+)
MVPGHEIVGAVSQVGEKVAKFKVGDHVGVGGFVDSCRRCKSCREELEQYCKSVTFTYNGKEQDGNHPTHGGYSTKIVVDENYVLRLPNNLPLDAAAPLLCAGTTLYSALRHWHIGTGKKVAIVGLGGLGHMGVKIAHAMGADITVFSHSLRKEADAKRMGATRFYSTSGALDEVASTFDLIICTVPVGLDWNQYMRLLKRDGAMVLVGIPEKDVPVGAPTLIFGRRSLAGSAVGGVKETQEMLDFCGKHNIAAEIELISIQQVNEAYERVLKSDVRYRFVIDIASLNASVS